jgi:hypothetical protein
MYEQFARSLFPFLQLDWSVFSGFAQSLFSTSQSSVLSPSLLPQLQAFFEQALSTPYCNASIIRPQNVENGVRFRLDRSFRFSARDYGVLHLCLRAQWRSLV